MIDRNDKVKGKIRQNAGDPNGVRSGYESNDSPDDFVLPSVGIESVDRSMMALFDSTIDFTVTSRGNSAVKVPVIFATGERFALLNQNKPIRDRNGAFILPMIAIRRTAIEQSVNDLTGRGINQHTGDLIIKRRLSSKDREYQKLVNKLGLENQSNIAEYDKESKPVGSYTKTGANRDDVDIKNGAHLKPILGKNVFEILVAAQPQFFTAVYEIIFWASFTQQMNQMIERLLGAQLPQGKTFRLDTSEGYWFVAYLDENKSSQDNFSDHAEQQRLIKYTFTMRVPAYIFAWKNPGDPSPIRRYYSAPRIRFGFADMQEGEQVVDPNLGADDPTLEYTLKGPMTIKRDKLDERELVNKQGVERYSVDPFSNKSEKIFVRVLHTNQAIGETVYSSEKHTNLDDLGT